MTGTRDATAVELAGVTRRFGGFTALDEVNLTIAPGTLHAIIGPNGAGKTTLFNILTGRLRPTAGRVLVDGRPAHQSPEHRRVAMGVARSFQVTSLFQDLTVRENVRLAASGRRLRRALSMWRPVEHDHAGLVRAGEVLDQVGLGRVAERRAAELSHGQQRLLEVAMALAPRPRILLLDEPTSGMGVDDIPAMESLLARLAGTHTVVMIEHNMALTMCIADNITVLVSGRVLTSGPPERIQSDIEVRRAYLGGESEGASDADAE